MTTLRPPRHKVVAAEVRAALSRQGLRQKDLAQALGITPASVSELWHGNVPYSLDRLDAIAEWLGVSIGDLLGGEVAPPHFPNGPHNPMQGAAASSGWNSRKQFRRLIRPSRTKLRSAA